MIFIAITLRLKFYFIWPLAEASLTLAGLNFLVSTVARQQQQQQLPPPSHAAPTRAPPALGRPPCRCSARAAARCSAPAPSLRPLRRAPLCRAGTRRARRRAGAAAPTCTCTTWSCSPRHACCRSTGTSVPASSCAGAQPRRPAPALPRLARAGCCCRTLACAAAGLASTGMAPRHLASASASPGPPPRHLTPAALAAPATPAAPVTPTLTPSHPSHPSSNPAYTHPGAQVRVRAPHAARPQAHLLHAVHDPAGQRGVARPVPRLPALLHQRRGALQHQHRALQDRAEQVPGCGAGAAGVGGMAVVVVVVVVRSAVAGGHQGRTACLSAGQAALQRWP
jgi:hypothetical protein